MTEHLLISLAKRRPYALKPTMPLGAYYDREAARWRLGNGFMLQEGLAPQSTKKCDQETGEDQKGE